jgi:hypothetical protein
LGVGFPPGRHKRKFGSHPGSKPSRKNIFITMHLGLASAFFF